jgi:cysteinyl-tRNA synthetase
MANYWMHNGFLQVEGEKMSKSTGNFITIRELLNKWPGDVLRLQMLMTHYRSPIDWTELRATQANLELEDWAHVLQRYYLMPNHKSPAAVADILADDLDTPNAITKLRELYNRAKKGGYDEIMEFGACCHFFGFRHLDKPGLFQFGTSGLGTGSARVLFDNADRVQALRAAYANTAPAEVVKVVSSISSEIEKSGVAVDVGQDFTITLVQGNRKMLEKKASDLVELRKAARARKDFKESDRIRDELVAMGITLKDGKDVDGNPTTIWEIAR